MGQPTDAAPGTRKRGRPRMSVDMARACAMLALGDSQKATAAQVGISLSTLLKRLREMADQAGVTPTEFLKRLREAGVSGA